MFGTRARMAITSFHDEGAKVFRELDANADGKLTKDELMSGMAARGAPLTSEEADAIIASADFDGDGAIQAKEWQTFARGAPSTLRLAQQQREIQAVFSNRPKWIVPERSHWLVTASHGNGPMVLGFGIAMSLVASGMIINTFGGGSYSEPTTAPSCCA